MRGSLLKNKLFGATLGFCVGDALGVPVEFLSREELKKSPVKNMLGYGTHNQPTGTWSDDSSLMFCLMEDLIKGYDVEQISKSISRWYSKGLWTPHGVVFDIGTATYNAIKKINEGNPIGQTGGKSESTNGNGSLMRILPLAFYLCNEKNIQKRLDIVSEVSSITHAHKRSIMACFLYVEIAIKLLDEKTFDEAIDDSIENFKIVFGNNPEISHFNSILTLKVKYYSEVEVRSSGYVIDTLEAALWCIYNSKSYSEGVLLAVNLGDDTDTVGAVTGGLLGIIYGHDSIPQNYIDKLVKKEQILHLCEMFYKVL